MTAPLPPVGTEGTMPLLGLARVTHHLTLPAGERVAVAVSGKGAGVVREWAPSDGASAEMPDLFGGPP
ncbi:hypothetical protein [Deinococcus multiflagellatus]|uniref:Uncharacterized protein n=1 Tax=Deinococcus multiflagellatus TaxID=1656887 RepID=A0ABW1ZPL3_9DEIO|nr:hypothetical protein [Deinococcus multiflagellatus]MBZ9715354.1 hypothetical protein [Deinococcus multiflagellatus]